MKKESLQNLPSSGKGYGQHGNTLLGFVVGLALGLSIALLVAWAITRNPPQEKANVRAPDVPITPKLNSDGSSTESRDINAPLKSKIRDNDSEDKEAKSESKTTSDKKTETKAESTSIYWLQIGAYSAKADAETQKANMALQGLQSNLSEHVAENKKVWRVRVGPFESSQDMQNTKRRLEDAGISFSVIKANKS
jgi:cell division protein FtsN